MPDHARADLVAWVTGAVDTATPVDIAAAVARAAAVDKGLDVSDDAAPDLVRRPCPLEVPQAVVADPWTLGSAFELAVGLADGDGARRRAGGVHYTPPAVARRLSEIVIADRHMPTACDPAVGGGAFLLAVADVLAAAGLDRATVVGEHLWGVDVDPDAVAVAEAALALWASERSWVTPPPGRLVVADTLLVGADAFGERRFDVVVGNPPFQNQLRSATAREAADVEALRRRWDVAAGPYADAASWFLLAARSLTADGGSLGLIVPESVLATADAEPVRSRLLDTAGLRGLWVGGRDVFADADVRVCAPVVDAGASPGASVARWSGPAFKPEPAVAWEPGIRAWSELLADLRGVPVVDIAGPTLDSWAEATAGFRDEFYGLARHAREHPGTGTWAPLVTVGMIDPFRLRWGTGHFRFAGERWHEPVVDPSAIDEADPRLGAWVRARRVPKVLVATQTKVIEVVVDAEGAIVPVTPVIAVTAAPDRLWHVAAALSSPIATALALRRHGGTAMSADTIKLSARQVLALPMPAPSAAWDRGAAAARAASEADDEAQWYEAMVELGRETVAAYGIGGARELLTWWTSRLSGWR